MRVVSRSEVSQASARMADCIKHLLGICRRSDSGRRLPRAGDSLHEVPAACQKFILTHGTASQKAGSHPMGVSQLAVGSDQRQSPRNRVLGKTPSCGCMVATGAANQSWRGPGVWHHGSSGGLSQENPNEDAPLWGTAHAASVMRLAAPVACWFSFGRMPPG